MRLFKVINSKGIYPLDFTGLVLEFIREHKDVPDYLCLKQPARDINGRTTGGFLWMDRKSLQEIDPRTGRPIPEGYAPPKERKPRQWRFSSALLNEYELQVINRWDNAYLRGRSDWKKGADENPYPEGTSPHLAWELGGIVAAESERPA